MVNFLVSSTDCFLPENIIMKIDSGWRTLTMELTKNSKTFWFTGNKQITDAEMWS